MKTEKAAILFNPSAGKGKALKKKVQLENLLQKFEIPFDMFVTQSEEDLKEHAREKSESYRILVGAGGDSTFNIIINEIIEKGTEITFGMIGLGSSNDITKEFETDSLEQACAALKRRNTKRMDLGCIVKNEKTLRYYLGQANIGLGVFVNKHVEELAIRKSSLGKHQTIAGTLGIIGSYLSRKIPFPLTLESEKGRIEGHFIVATFSNIRYWATGKEVTPQALPDDGFLDCCLIHKCSFARLAQLIFLSKKGKHTGAKEVETLQSKCFDVSSGEAFEIQTDGEIIGGLHQPARFNKIRFKIIPQALSIIC